MFAQLATFSVISVTVIHFNSFHFVSVKVSDRTPYSVIGTTTEGVTTINDCASSYPSQ